MIKHLQTRFLLSFVLCGILLISCTKQEINDLFPLKTGNEFYFRYNKSEYTGISADTKGTETWKVVNESSQRDSIKYIIERKLNALLTVAGSSTVISNSITYLEIYEDKSSSIISIWGFFFKRYQSVSQIELKSEGYSSMPSLTCLFKADSGLTRYSYYHPPNHIVIESLHLDSLKITKP